MDEEIRAIVEAEHERNRAAMRDREERLRRARTEAKRLAAELARLDPAVREVWLFGSVAHGRPGREQFDIDLAIEGGDAISLYARLPNSEFDVDIVDLENVGDQFREMVKQTGVQLYGTNS